MKLDPHLTYDNHIIHLSKTAFFHLKNIAKPRPSLTLPDAEKLIHAFVSSRLDYCNALLFGIHNKNLQKLQYIQNSAARVLMRVRKHEHITPVLQSLHWLPITSRIQYKLALLTHQCLYGNAPAYLQELLLYTNNPQPATFDHKTLICPKSPELSYGQWETAHSAQLLPVCGTPWWMDVSGCF